MYVYICVPVYTLEARNHGPLTDAVTANFELPIFILFQYSHVHVI